jgi:hypothetical protein
MVIEPFISEELLDKIDDAYETMYGESIDVEDLQEVLEFIDKNKEFTDEQLYECIARLHYEEAMENNKALQKAKKVLNNDKHLHSVL